MAWTTAELDRRRRASTGQVLLRVARLYNEAAIARLQALGHPDVRLVHTTLLPHLDVDGTRLTTLAERMGVSKQAVGPLVDELEALGYLERRPDPRDGRARIVAYTEKGRAAMLDGLRALGEVEAQVRAAAGDDVLDELRRVLDRVLDALEPAE